jgi:hypothetical protein
MKVLALALLGLAGYAGSAAASCPSSPVPPWTAVVTNGGSATIVSPGLAGTACHLDSTVLTGADSTAFASVEDDTPTAEMRYRAQFIVKLDGLASPTLDTSATVFSSLSTNGPGITMGIFGDGSGAWFVSYVVPNASDPTGVTTGSAALAAGENRVEFDLQTGAAGSITLWVNNNVEGTPTVPAVTVDNSAAGGVETSFMGLAGPSGQFVTSYAGAAAAFDQFDSRRQTFIGF